MKFCFCNRLYRASEPNAITEYAFSGSLCRIREFETADGLRYCLTIFSLSDYKHLHFPHNEYNCLIKKLYALQSTQSILPSASKLNVCMVVKLIPFDCDFKIKFGNHNLTIGPVTAIGLVRTAPFDDVDVFSVNKKPFTCDSKWDICTCNSCPVFKRLIEFEACVLRRFSHRRPKNVILKSGEGFEKKSFRFYLMIVKKFCNTIYQSLHNRLKRWFHYILAHGGVISI